MGCHVHGRISLADEGFHSNLNSIRCRWKVISEIALAKEKRWLKMQGSAVQDNGLAPDRLRASWGSGGIPAG